MIIIHRDRNLLSSNHVKKSDDYKKPEIPFAVIQRRSPCTNIISGQTIITIVKILYS